MPQRDRGAYPAHYSAAAYHLRRGDALRFWGYLYRNQRLLLCDVLQLPGLRQHGVPPDYRQAADYPQFAAAVYLRWRQRSSMRTGLLQCRRVLGRVRIVPRLRQHGQFFHTAC